MVRDSNRGATEGLWSTHHFLDRRSLALNMSACKTRGTFLERKEKTMPFMSPSVSGCERGGTFVGAAQATGDRHVQRLHL